MRTLLQDYDLKFDKEFILSIKIQNLTLILEPLKKTAKRVRAQRHLHAVNEHAEHGIYQDFQDQDYLVKCRLFIG